MNNYLEWDKSYSSCRRITESERAENRKIVLYVLASMALWGGMFCGMFYLLGA